MYVCITVGYSTHHFKEFFTGIDNATSISIGLEGGCDGWGAMKWYRKSSIKSEKQPNGISWPFSHLHNK